MNPAATPNQNDPRLLQLSPQDNICVTTGRISRGETLHFKGESFQAQDDVPLGHKIAVTDLPVGEKVYKYGASIGSVTKPIPAGSYVHTHNVKSDYLPTYTQEAAFHDSSQ